MVDILTQEERSYIFEDVQSMIDDPQIGGSIIYQSFVSRGTFDPTTGKTTNVFAGTWINTSGRAISDYEVKISDGYFQTGDYYYYVATRDIIKPKKDDRFIDSGTTYFVYEFTTDMLKSFHTLVSRKI